MGAIQSHLLRRIIYCSTCLPLYLQRSQTQLLQRQPLEEEDEQLQTKCESCATHQQALESEVQSLQEKSVNVAAQKQQQKEQALQTKLASHSLQTKLKIGVPHDKYEQEADRIADQVMRVPEPKVQRQAEPEEEEEELIQTKIIANTITPLIPVYAIELRYEGLKCNLPRRQAGKTATYGDEA